MKEIQLQPQLRFPEFEGDWEEKRLGDEANFFSGGTPLSSKKEFYNGNIPFIKSGEIDSRITEQFINELAIKNSSAKMVTTGDLLYALYGATSGQSAISKITGAINQAVLCIKSETINLIYLNNLFIYEKNNIINRFLQGGQGNLSASIIKDLKYYFPFLPEQQKIADYLTTIDRKIELLEEKKTELNRYKKAMMQKLFSQEIRFKDDNGNDFPDWEEKRLGEISDIITGKTPSTSDESNWGSDIQFITPSDLKDDLKYIESTERYVVNKKNKILPKGSIVYTCIASIGKIGLTKRLAITNQQINSLIVNKDNNEYIYYQLLYITPYIKSTQANTTLPIINKTDFSKFKIKISCIEEQQKIANFLSAIDNNITKVEEQIKGTQNFKKAMLQQMFV